MSETTDVLDRLLAWVRKRTKNKRTLLSVGERHDSFDDCLRGLRERSEWFGARSELSRLEAWIWKERARIRRETQK